VSDGQVRHHIVETAPVRRVIGKCVPHRGRQGTKRRFWLRRKPQHVRAEPASPAPLGPKLRDRGGCSGQFRQCRLIDHGRRHERVQHGDVGRDTPLGGLIEPLTMLGNRSLGGRNCHNDSACGCLPHTRSLLAGPGQAFDADPLMTRTARVRGRPHMPRIAWAASRAHRRAELVARWSGQGLRLISRWLGVDCDVAAQTYRDRCRRDEVALACAIRERTAEIAARGAGAGLIWSPALAGHIGEIQQNLRRPASPESPLPGGRLRARWRRGGSTLATGSCCSMSLARLTDDARRDH